MTPIAAYYVMVISDLERERADARRSRDAVARMSRADRIVQALEALVRLGRPATTQPA